MNSSAMTIFVLMSVALKLAAEPQCDPGPLSEDPLYNTLVASILLWLQTHTPVFAGHNSGFSSSVNSIGVAGRATCSAIAQQECFACLAVAVNEIKAKCSNSVGASLDANYSKSARVDGQYCSISYEPAQV